MNPLKGGYECGRFTLKTIRGEGYDPARVPSGGGGRKAKRRTDTWMNQRAGLHLIRKDQNLSTKKGSGTRDKETELSLLP